MNPEDKQIVEMLYPIIKIKVKEQLNLKALSVSIGLDTESNACVHISDGEKIMMLPFMTPDMRNVSKDVDVLALKAFILS